MIHSRPVQKSQKFSDPYTNKLKGCIFQKKVTYEVPPANLKIVKNPAETDPWVSVPIVS